MGEVEEALEKYQGLVPLVYDIETMALEVARPEEMQRAVYLKRVADKEFRKMQRALWLARAERNKALAAIVHCEGAWFAIFDMAQSGVFWNKGGKLLAASEKCRAYADKFK